MLPDPSTNERLADSIKREWGFRIKRAPETIITRCGIIVVILAFLEVLLVVSNNIYYLGWDWFIQWSTQYRDKLIESSVGSTMHLGSSRLAPFSLWRGWVIPTLLAGTTYVFVALLSLRHELYHWRPELLSLYIDRCKTSSLGRYFPSYWWDVVFDAYQDEHRKHINSRIQKRTHIAMEDSRQFARVVRVVAYNIYISSIALFVYWVILLQTKINAETIVHLPRSYVPPVQGLVWYFVNDFFYFYPHWMAHHGPASTSRFVYRFLPQQLAQALHTHFRVSHKLHHRTKANLGIAAWYCSPSEQILFNLLPALMGPFLTQVLADVFQCEQIWGTHLATLYVWLMAGSAMSVLGHTGYRSRFNDPGKHDLHHENAFDPEASVNFGTMGFFDWLHSTASSIPKEDAKAWREQRNHQAALYEASRRSGIPLAAEQRQVVQQPKHDQEWEDTRE